LFAMDLDPRLWLLGFVFFVSSSDFVGRELFT